MDLDLLVPLLNIHCLSESAFHVELVKYIQFIITYFPNPACLFQDKACLFQDKAGLQGTGSVLDPTDMTYIVFEKFSQIQVAVADLYDKTHLFETKTQLQALRKIVLFCLRINLALDHKKYPKEMMEHFYQCYDPLRLFHILKIANDKLKEM